MKRTTKKTLVDIREKDDKEDFTGHTRKGRQRRLYWTYVKMTTRRLYWTYVEMMTKKTLLDIREKDDKEDFTRHT